MTQTVAQDDKRAARAIEAVLPVIFADPYRGLVVTEGETLVAALVFNNFDRINIDLSITIRAPLRTRAIREIARYLFGRLGVKRVTCVTEATNDQAINRLRSIGFVQEGKLRQRFPSGDGLIFSLLASEQKFARLTDGLDALRP